MNKKYKLWIALTLLVVFALGVAGGVLGERYFMHKRDRRPGQERTPFPLLEPVAKALGLTVEQRDKIREVFKQNDERMKGLDTEIHARLREMRGRLKGEIDGILTAEQRLKLDEMIKKEMAKHQPKKNSKEPQRSDTNTPPEKR